MRAEVIKRALDRLEQVRQIYNIPREAKALAEYIREKNIHIELFEETGLVIITKPTLIIQ